MLIVSDCPENINGLVGPDSAWQEKSIDILDRADRALWEGLSLRTSAWLGEGLDRELKGFWSRIFVIGEAPSSQFDILHRVLGTEIRFPGPVACLALQGRNFRGQRGRAWKAEPGNLHLCAGFEPYDLEARDGIALSMLPAVAVVEAVRAVSHEKLKPGIKWVNDILLDNRKVAGVITSTQAMSGKIKAVTLGIGINVSRAPQVPPTPFVPVVGCLGDSFSLVDVLTAVLASLGNHYTKLIDQGPEALFTAYHRASVVIDREVCIWDEADPEGELPAPRITGVVRDIFPDLSLRIEGWEKPVIKGRLAFSNWRHLLPSAST